MNEWSLMPDLLIVTGLVAFTALSLVTARRYLDPNGNEVVKELNRLLPQTQCAQCGYPGCRPYAEAMADGAPVTLCPPGGDRTAEKLAEKLGRSLEQNKVKQPELAIAKIIESECIGCTLCITACPVDAIVGARNQIHTVLNEICTGCELCIPPCPVDCIDLESQPKTEYPTFPEEPMACINCGFCIATCPKDLQPHLLYRYRRDSDIADGFRIDDCIECRRCDQVCPSMIPLTDNFRVTKQVRAELEKARAAAQINEVRFLARQTRLNQSINTVVSKPSQRDLESILDQIKLNT